MSDKSLTNREYIARINKAFDYIEAHLDKPMTLEELASVANFSRFHFSRIFASIVGETPFQFILCIRLEKAATLLCSSSHESITDIALKCGFSDISIFSRNFRQYFRVSASEYRKRKSQLSNLSQTDSNLQQAPLNALPLFLPGVTNL